MKSYKVKVREHEEYGGLGLVIDTGRDYFEPALSGLICAHDILEHPATPHPNGYVDELMALGGVIAGRINSGWRNKYGRLISFTDIRSDVSSLIIADLHSCSSEMQHIPAIKRYIQNSDFMSYLREEVREGIKEGVADFFCDWEKYEEIKTRKLYNLSYITAWIVTGYRAWKRRFEQYGDYSIAVTLFDSIAKQCDWFIKTGEEYDEGVLHVDFESATAWIERSEKEY